MSKNKVSGLASKANRATQGKRGSIGSTGKNTTYRAERVSQGQAMKITAGKKAGLYGTVASRPASEQTKQAVSGAMMMTDRRPFGS